MTSNPVDYVNTPPHYIPSDPTYETIKVIEAWGLSDSFCLANVIKYVSRARRKGSQLQDLKKAAWYLNREIQNLQKGKIHVLEKEIS